MCFTFRPALERVYGYYDANARGPRADNLLHDLRDRYSTDGHRVILVSGAIIRSVALGLTLLCAVDSPAAY